MANKIGKSKKANMKVLKNHLISNLISQLFKCIKCSCNDWLAKLLNQPAILKSNILRNRLL